MKKTVLILLVSFSFCFTELLSQGFSYGPQLGFSGTTIIEKDELWPVEKKSLKIGYQLGVAAEFEIMSFLYVGTSLNFFQKGDKIIGESDTKKTRLGYLDLPIVIGYKMPIGNVSVFGNIGPYTSVAIVGKTSYIYEYEEHNSESSYPIEFGEFGEYKRFDSGVTIGAGADFKNYQLKANYYFGFVDINTSETITARNSVFNIVFTYFINRNY